MALPGAYNGNLVALSVVVAAVAAYVALALAERVTDNRGRARYVWLVVGACVMGSGIWAMHFTGMLAFVMPVAISYDVPLVALSLIAAIVASGIALDVTTRARMSVLSWLCGGVLMGGGITAMHYIGMAAMRMPAKALWDGWIVALSVVIAVVVSLVALLLVFRLRAVTRHPFEWRRVSAAMIMGIAIAGMHYTGMAAATFVPNALPQSTGFLVNAAHLSGTGIAFIAFTGLAVALGVALIDRRLAAQESALAVSQHHFRTVVANAPVVIIALDADGTVTMAEGHGLAALGNSPNAMVGRAFAELYRDAPALVGQARRALAGEPHTSTSTVRGVALETHWMPLRDDGGAVSGAIGVSTDITERRRAENALKHQALHDALTDLPNRTFFNERVSATLQLAEHTRTPCCLGVIDLDRFKDVNDTLGHQVGDALLEQVAGRLTAALGPTAVAARLGGDEFAFLLPRASEAQGIATGQQVLAALGASYVVGGHTLDIRGSLGLAVYPSHGHDAATLLRHADVAMYVAKRERLGCAVYDAAKDRHDARRLTMQADLREAITRGDLQLHYQPQVDVASGRIAQVEALIRWPHPVLGLLPPDQFIPLAEETELIIPLTRWVLEAALGQLRAWEDAGLVLGVAVNLSMRNLRDSGLPEAVGTLLLRYRIAPDRLMLEVTESAVMADRTQTRDVFTRLASLGIGLSIDDFGTGYSSLDYLKQLPVGELKIDKSFVLGMTDAASKDAEIVRLIRDLGRTLGLRVVAEGVETAASWDMLQTMGCDVVQGYYVSRPLPADELGDWLRRAPWIVGPLDLLNVPD